MNSDTGQVLPEMELLKKLGSMTPEARAAETAKWRIFEIGEVISIKGINFKVHEVGDSRLVLKFAGSVIPF